MKNGNTPAAPLTGNAYENFAGYDETPNTSYDPECQGLTKREHFAGLAMQGLISFYGNAVKVSDMDVAVKCAEELLKELEK